VLKSHGAGAVPAGTCGWCGAQEPKVACAPMAVVAWVPGCALSSAATGVFSAQGPKQAKGLYTKSGQECVPPGSNQRVLARNTPLLYRAATRRPVPHSEHPGSRSRPRAVLLCAPASPFWLVLV
jgi:hypothetical protein